MVIMGSHGSVRKNGTIAIKTYNRREPFMRELFMYKILEKYPYIPLLRGYENNSITMECMDGDILDLFSNSFKERKFMLNALMSNISSAINYMKSVGISHCDIKPSNIFYKFYGNNVRFKIADFSCSRIRETYDLQIYTPQYRPVEFISDIGGDTYYSDIWAFGITCLDFLLGERVINGRNDTEILTFLYSMRKDKSVNVAEFMDGINSPDGNYLDVEAILEEKNITCSNNLLEKLKNMLFFFPEDRKLEEGMIKGHITPLLTSSHHDFPEYVRNFIDNNKCSDNFMTICNNINPGFISDDTTHVESWILSLHITSILLDNVIDLNYIIDEICKENGKWIDRSSLMEKLNNVSFFENICL